MSRRLSIEADRVRDRVERGDPYWPAQLAVALAIALNLGLPEKITVTPTWLLPAVEAVLLLALVVLAPRRVTAHSARRRRLSLVVVGLVSLASVVSLALLAKHLIDGGDEDGGRLLLSGLMLWVTNVLLFAVWYWELDAGGPAARFLGPEGMADFQFPQTGSRQPALERWRPGFLDYLYTSLTNSTAFSPTDTMPLTHTAKIVMGLQSVAALATLGLVVARAVNILA